jgi:TonB-linked SusC/RagA family outer membrane protein
MLNALMKNHLVYNILALLMPLTLLAQQNVTVTGVIYDEFGMPLPGATVIEVGTVNGVSTDFDGIYSIEVLEGANLEYSYVGYQAQTALANNANPINISLIPDNELKEVVVVAFGTQSKQSIVGSVAVISESDIQSQPATTITQAIQGSVPGINVVNTGGVPGTNPTIRIRGVGSINASAAPLIIVDGAPFNGNLNSIAQEQVASISILKDASSTSLYGSRGANGVIIVTTKSGSKATPIRISLSTVYGNSNMATPMHDLLEIDDYTRFFWEAYRNNELYVNELSAVEAGAAASSNLVSALAYNPYGVDQPVDNQGNLNATPAWNTDWKGAILNNNAYKKQHGLSISGGSEKTTFYMGTNYIKEQGQVKNTYFERFATRLNLDTQVNDFIKSGFNISYTTSKQNAPNQSGTSYSNSIQWIYTIPSYYPLYRRGSDGGLTNDANGQPEFDYGNNNSQIVNGVRPALSNENGLGAIVNNKILKTRTYTSMNGYLKIDLLPELNFKSNIFYERATLDDFRYTHYKFGSASSVGGRVSQDRDFFTTINAIQTLNYSNNFGAHTVNADAIFESYRFEQNLLDAQGTGYLPNVKVLNGSTVPEGVGGAINEERILSAITRLSYNYDNTYFAEVSFRRDGSTKFSKDTRWGNFYSFGGSWIVSNESFINDIDWVDYLKFKFSYGELGNNRNIGFFPYLQVFDTGYNQLDNTGVISSEFVDPNLTWEKTALQNIGTEFTLFEGKLQGSIEYYSKESIDLIYDKPLALSTGNESIKTNVGAIKNYGVEFSFNSRVLKKDELSVDFGINFSFDRNEISDLTQDEFINGTKKWKVGKSLYEFFIRESAGVDPADGYQMWYKDVLNDQGEATGERTTTKEFSEATRYYLDKSSLPKMIGGFNANVNYKNFDLSALINFSFGSYVYDGVYSSLMSGFESPGRNGHPDLKRRWQNPGDQTDVPLFLNGQNDFNATSSRFLFKNNYLRVRGLNLGYTFDESWMQKYQIQGLRIYLQGDNLFTYQSHKGIDPEQAISGMTNYRSHQMKTISLGINVQL